LKHDERRAGIESPDCLYASQQGDSRVAKSCLLGTGDCTTAVPTGLDIPWREDSPPVVITIDLRERAKRLWLRRKGASREYKSSGRGKPADAGFSTETRDDV